MIHSAGYIYFAIKTEDENFGLSEFNEYLSITPTKFTQRGTNGKRPFCSVWEYASADLTHSNYYAELETLIERLSPHTKEFVRLKNEKIDLFFVLQLVIYVGENSPALSFSTKVIQFLHEVGAEIDCDIYKVRD
jgi:hypothetical protein